MANLKEDLDQYLLLNNEQKKSNKFEMKLPTLKMTKIGKLFGNIDLESNTRIITQNSYWFQLSRIQRVIGFIICFGLGILFMTLSTFYIPVLILRARKFALLYSLGCFFFISSFCFLFGFMTFCKSIFSKQKWVFSFLYTGTLVLTIYFATIFQSATLTIFFAAMQIICLLSIIVDMIPGGTNGIKFFSQIYKNKVSQSFQI